MLGFGKEPFCHGGFAFGQHFEAIFEIQGLFDGNFGRS
jgi:hypothetical protein